jgi:hypothetical protein
MEISWHEKSRSMGAGAQSCIPLRMEGIKRRFLYEAKM